MVSISTALKYYKRPEIQEAIFRATTDKEIGVRFDHGGYGKRPDVIAYPRDVLEFAKRKATSFHCSEELWVNPLQVTTGMRKKELDELRKSWDLIIDIDCPFLEYSQAAAHVLVQALQHHGIKSIGLKFSGNHGFHIGVPAKAFPEKVNDVETKNMFPDGPRRIAYYLQEFTREMLAKLMLEQESIQEIIKKTEKPFEEIVTNGAFDPYKIVDIDTVLIASRHLYRTAYSLNEKSGLVSIPITPEEILTFDKQRAEPDRVQYTTDFLPTDVQRGEAEKLIVQAFDYKPKTQEEPKAIKKQHSDFDVLQNAVPEEYFPPCINNILKGITDGKKRSLFVLVNFLTSVGWSYDAIEEFLKKWNEKNNEPLREVHIVGHIRYHKQNKKKVLPPNCKNQQYYVELAFCQPDSFCSRIKNPVNYAILKQKIAAKEQKSVKKD